MKGITHDIRAWLVVLLLALLLATATIASAGGGYTLDWWTVDGGGGSLGGASYSLQATLGQPDAGLLDGGDYTLAGGFWTAAGQTPAGINVYLPLIVTE